MSDDQERFVVKALKDGYYDDRRRKKGTEFVVHGKQNLSLDRELTGKDRKGNEFKTVYKGWMQIVEGREAKPSEPVEEKVEAKSMAEIAKENKAPEPKLAVEEVAEEPERSGDEETDPGVSSDEDVI